MNLKQAQQHLSRDAKYRQQYDKHKDAVQLAMHTLAIRKELAVSHSALASELGISKYDISKFENLRGHVEPWVISVIVTRFQNELRKRGIQLEKWFVPRPSPKEFPKKGGQEAASSGTRTPNLQTSRHDTRTALPISRQRLNTQEIEESKF
jgi:DNA-binding XRE family transcriptional regulator